MHPKVYKATGLYKLKMESVEKNQPRIFAHKEFDPAVLRSIIANWVASSDHVNNLFNFRLSWRLKILGLCAPSLIAIHLQ